jgi:RNA polymerase sigma-70 factor (ECF subfamily)
MGPEEQHCLVERARNGDGEAWESLYRHAYPRLRAYAVRHGDPQVAEDLVSETMVRAVAGIGRFRWEAVGFDAWLFGILRHVCADHHRADSRRRNKPGHVGEHSEGQPGDDLLLSEEHAEIMDAFERLDPREREVLELRVIAGLSAEQVGQLLGKRAGAIRMAQSRALARLRELLEKRQ